MIGNNRATGFKPFLPSIYSSGNINFDSWKTGYTASIKEENNPIQTTSKMYNCVFKTSEGRKFNIPFNEDRTVEDLILTFFRRVDREVLFKEGGIAFLYNAAKMGYHDKNPIKKILDLISTLQLLLLILED